MKRGRIRVTGCASLLVAVLLLLMPLYGVTGLEGSRAAPPPRAKRVLIISLDGLDARYLQQRDEYGLKIPTLRRLIAEGTAARGVISVYPSVTYPAHTSIVTGAYPARHAIFGNELFEPPETPPTLGWHWFARDIRIETLWDAAGRGGLSTAMVSWPVAGGAGDYNIPEISQIGGSRLETLALMKAHARPLGLVEEIERHDPSLYRNVNADESDDMRTRFGEYIIEKKRPRVMFIHLFDLDHFQHNYGPFTPQAFSILEKVDGYVARLLASAERAGILKEMAVFIVSDHGFLPISKLIHPGVVLARAGLLKVREEKGAPEARLRPIITDWRALPYVTSASCAIILRDPNDTGTLNRALGAFKDLTVGDEDGLPHQGRRVLRVLTAKDVRALGGNPRAALMLEAADGYSFGNNYTGAAVTPSKQLGQHGYLPTHPNYYASFIASGVGITRGKDLGLIRMIDVGPTIAHTLGLKLRDADGRALRVESSQ